MGLPRIWRLRHQYYRLIGEKCGGCGTKIFPPRDVCPKCGGSTTPDLQEKMVPKPNPD